MLRPMFLTFKQPALALILFSFMIAPATAEDVTYPPGPLQNVADRSVGYYELSVT